MVPKNETNQSIYIIDTNVLLIDPDSIYAYPEATVIIPISVVEELDNFTKRINEAGRHARNLVKTLDNIKLQGSFSDGIPIENGAILKIWLDSSIHRTMPVFADMQKSSNRVLSSILSIKDHFKGQKICLITNNSNLRLKASLHGIDSSNYREDGIEQSDVYEKLTQLTFSASELEDLAKFDHIPLKDKNHDFYANQHFKINDQKELLCRYIARSNYLKRVQDFSAGVWNITPRNPEQKAALDILLDKSIDIVILAGKAGTGKTLLALAAALESLLVADDTRKILVSRPIVPLGKDLGYLPGDIEEKIAPWMKPIFDNLEFLTSRVNRKSSRLGNLKRILDKGLIELEALTYIRGRSIPNRFMIVDEAQNLTPHEIKTIITRIGYNTKLVLTGDPYQIDNPYVDSISNGLTYVIEKLKPYDSAAHVNLIYGERSRLAELAANVL